MAARNLREIAAPCKFEPKKVLCNKADIRDNVCEICSWNPEVYKKRVIELKTKYGKKG